ncbi:MAG: cell division protein SepF [Firmicutes bacterium]|nr:cell division protein SepF [Bacillota bacterium]
MGKIGEDAGREIAVGKGILDRVLDFMGFGGEPDEAEGEYDVYDSRGARSDPRADSRATRKLVPLKTAKQARLVITEPARFEDVQEVADNLKGRRPVIVNVDALEKDVARRVLDFAAGVTYALDGGMQKVGEGIFLFTPSNFDVAGEIQSGDGDEDSTFFAKR